jgi:hypothetical protein
MKPTVVCAWCTRVLSEGTQDVSHGICSPCARNVLRSAEEMSRNEGPRLSRYLAVPA